MANDDNWNQDQDYDRDSFDQQYDEQYQPPRQGMSTGVKVLIVLLVLFGGGMLLCCGAFALMGYMFMPKVSTTPADVIAVRDEMVTIDLPDDLEPKQSLRMDNLMFAMKTAMFESRDGKSQLMIASMHVKIGGPEANNELQVRNALEDQGESQRPLANSETKTQSVKIKGADHDFVFTKGEDAQTGRKMRQVSGTFPGREGTAFLMYQTEEDNYDEERVVKMLESIR